MIAEVESSWLSRSVILRSDMRASTSLLFFLGRGGGGNWNCFRIGIMMFWKGHIPNFHT